MHVVDLTGDYEGRDPLEDYDIINRELALYADELAARPRIVVANKTDVPGTEEAAERLAARVREDSIARMQVRLAVGRVAAREQHRGGHDAVGGDEIRIVGRAFGFESARTAEDMFKELDL